MVECDGDVMFVSVFRTFKGDVFGDRGWRRCKLHGGVSCRVIEGPRLCGGRGV